MTQIALIFVVIITTLSYFTAEAQGPPPSGYFIQGQVRRPPGPPPPHYVSHSPSGPPPSSPSFSLRGPPPKYKLASSSNLLGWLGSRMPSFLSSSRHSPKSKNSPKQQQQQPKYPHPPPTAAGQQSHSPLYGSGVSAVMFPMPSFFSRLPSSSSSGGSHRAQLYGQKPSSVTYYTSTSTVTKDPLRPGHDVYSSTPLSPMGTFPIGGGPSFSYVSSPQQSAPSQSHQQQIKFVSPSGSLYSAAPSPQPQYSSYIEPQVQSSEHLYSIPGGRVVHSYSPQYVAAPPPSARASPPPPQESNIEVLPSQMVSYNQQTLSTGSPEYQAALAGMESSQSPMTVPSPTASSQYPYYLSHYRQEPQVQQQQQQQQYGYPQIDQQQSIALEQYPQYASERYDPSPSQSPPMFDLSSLGGDQEEAAYPYQLQTSVGKSSAPQESVNLEALLSSLRDQYGNQAQFEVQGDNGEMQGGYSYQHEVAVPPPAEASQVSSSSQQGVQILSQGSEQGNPVFEIMADANAPMYNGHPFDVNQLISMIEPGAQIEGSAPSGSENHETYAEPPSQGTSSVDESSG